MNDRRAFSVAVFAFCNDQVLLIHHKRLAVWLPVGGELEPGERPVRQERDRRGGVVRGPRRRRDGPAEVEGRGGLCFVLVFRNEYLGEMEKTSFVNSFLGSRAIFSCRDGCNPPTTNQSPYQPFLFLSPPSNPAGPTA